MISTRVVSFFVITKNVISNTDGRKFYCQMRPPGGNFPDIRGSVSKIPGILLTVSKIPRILLTDPPIVRKVSSRRPRMAVKFPPTNFRNHFFLFFNRPRRHVLEIMNFSLKFH